MDIVVSLFDKTERKSPLAKKNNGTLAEVETIASVNADTVLRAPTFLTAFLKLVPRVVFISFIFVFNTNISSLDSDISKALIYKGTFTGDLDDLNGSSNAGVYGINGRAIVTSSNMWAYLINFSNIGFTCQLLLPTSSSIYYRYYSGSPASWSSWRTVSLTAVS